MVMEKSLRQATLLGFTFLILLFAIPMSSSTVLAAKSPMEFELTSTTLNISTFYNGTTLEVKGKVPVAADVVLQVSGPRHEVHLKEKGKVAGFLWMNTGDVTLENTPAVYMIYLPSGSQEDFINPSTAIGYKALLSEVTIHPESADKEYIFGEYIKLMEKSGVYAVNDSAIRYGDTRDAMKDFSATLTIPPKMSAGTYSVKAIAVTDGVAGEPIQKDLTLTLSGFPKLIASMANGKPLLFGVMAVFIAVAAGLVMGVLFRGGGAH